MTAWQRLPYAYSDLVIGYKIPYFIAILGQRRIEGQHKKLIGSDVMILHTDCTLVTTVQGGIVARLHNFVGDFPASLYWRRVYLPEFYAGWKCINVTPTANLIFSLRVPSLLLPTVIYPVLSPTVTGTKHRS